MKRLLLITLLTLITVSMVSAAQVSIVRTNPAPAVAGEYTDVTFRIYNPVGADQLDTTTLAIQENAFITQVSPAFQTSRLGSGQDATATLRIYISEEAPQGDIQLVSELIQNQNVQKTTHELFVEDAKQQAELVIGSVHTTPSELLADTDDNEIRVDVQNLGEKDAELVTADLLTPDYITASFAYSLRDSVSSIPAGDQQTLTFTADIAQQVRQSVNASLALRYRTKRDNSNQYDRFEVITPFLIPITESPFLEVVDVSAQTDFAAGTTENTLRITIANTGQQEAEDVRVRLFPDISFPFIFEQTSQYIGAKIRPGENVSIDVTFEVLSDAQKRSYPVAVELESIVGATRYAQDAEVPIVVTSQQSTSSSQVGWLIITVIALIAASLGVMRYRKRTN